VFTQQVQVIFTKAVKMVLRQGLLVLGVLGAVVAQTGKVETEEMVLVQHKAVVEAGPMEAATGGLQILLAQTGELVELAERVLLEVWGPQALARRVMEQTVLAVEVDGILVV